MQLLLPSSVGSNRRRQLAAITCLLAAFCCLGGCSRPTESISWLKVSPPEQSLELALMYRDASPPETFFESVAAIIKSPNVLRAVLDRQEISRLPLVEGQTDPAEWLKSHIVVARPDQSEVLQIKLVSTRPSDAVRIVDAVRDAYIDYVVDEERKQIAAKYDAFNERLLESAEQLKNLLAASAEEANPTDLQREEIRRLEKDVAHLHAELKKYSGFMGRHPTTARVTPLIDAVTPK
jgi:uncharacterized protein involved in exopolysaccharide biosynthesis